VSGLWLRLGRGLVAQKARDDKTHGMTTPMKSPQKIRKREMSKQAMREETERLVKEALERKALTVKQGETRIDSKCRKCGALNRVSAAQGQVRVEYTCKECGENQRTF
jgi:predicted RNA-binding Zn-ribbon protein involved in translation (DUF1610 family)